MLLIPQPTYRVPGGFIMPGAVTNWFFYYEYGRTWIREVPKAVASPRG